MTKDSFDEEIKSIYSNFRNEESGFAALATCKTLMHFLNTDNSSTLQETSKKIKSIIAKLKDLESLSEVESLSEIFLRFITLQSSEYQSIDLLREALKARGALFLEKVLKCESKIAHYGHPFISDGSSILVHGYSQVISVTLCQALKAGRRFFVYVTHSGPDNSGEKMYQILTEKEIPCKLILDPAIGYYMEKVDMVLVGAEGVMENGGIINKIGTYPLALCAKALNKPFYVLAESYKFIRYFPFSQSDLPRPIRYKRSLSQISNSDLDHPLIDYTPPEYITLLHTDLGTLTTAAVSDVLIQLYV